MDSSLSELLKGREARGIAHREEGLCTTKRQKSLLTYELFLRNELNHLQLAYVGRECKIRFSAWITSLCVACKFRFLSRQQLVKSLLNLPFVDRSFWLLSRCFCCESSERLASYFLAYSLYSYPLDTLMKATYWCTLNNVALRGSQKGMGEQCVRISNKSLKCSWGSSIHQKWGCF